MELGPDPHAEETRKEEKMKSKITYLDITIPGERPAYFGIHRGSKVTTIGRHISMTRVCLIASLADELMENAGMMAFPKGEPGGNHIHLTWFNKNWQEELEEK
jgi:hypothetical protein